MSVGCEKTPIVESHSFPFGDSTTKCIFSYTISKELSSRKVCVTAQKQVSFLK